MLLAIDLGNTHTVLGVFSERRLLAQWRVRTERERTSDEWGVLLSNLFATSRVPLGGITAIIVASVVPPLNNAFVSLGQRYFGLTPLFVGPGVKTGMPILYDNPRELGADRIVNAVAAFDRHACDLIVVDFGTATKFECVSKKGEYLGGVIAPGVMISAEALFQRASKLPRVELFQKPKTVIGRDTISGMSSGLVFGFAAMVDGMVAAIDAERGVTSKVIATGGLAPMVAGQARSISEVDEHLTLWGLRLIHERNQ